MFGNDQNPKRHFVFLQGPHGPFFDVLADMLRTAGCQTTRIGFNAGDAYFWSDAESFIPFTKDSAEWPGFFEETIERTQATDVVLYGDVREVHARAIEIAKARGLTVHVFEEGYMRPFWITYERGGSNGHSRLIDMDVSQMQAALAQTDLETPLPPAHWGDTRQHVFYGALYHFHVMFRNQKFPNFKPHRSLTVSQEFRLYLRKLLFLPAQAIKRFLATRRIQNGGFPYHLVLLQLEHDSAFQKHSPFETMTEFLETVVDGFAKGAPRHHHLVFKAHPLEDGRSPIRKTLTRLAKTYGLEDRIHYVRGGKLAQMLNETRTAVTVNSTAGQQVLWRGIPLKTFGASVYSKPEFVSDLPLSEFFKNPTRPDNKAYKDFRRYLLETSQIPGGFYSAKGRRQAMRLVVDMMLSKEDPYDALKSGHAAPRQQLRVVS